MCKSVIDENKFHIPEQCEDCGRMAVCFEMCCMKDKPCSEKVPVADDYCAECEIRY